MPPFWLSRTACRRAASIWAFAPDRENFGYARISDCSNADPLAVLQIGFASDGDHARRGLLRISAYGQARKHNI
jgi:hypothetical protein